MNRTTISRAIQQTRPLLNQHGPATAEPPAARLHTLADIAAYAASQGIMPDAGIEIGALMICEP